MIGNRTSLAQCGCAIQLDHRVEIEIIADAVGDDLPLLMDSGIRSGLDIVRALALGARAVMIGRPWVYALAARQQAGVSELLAMFAHEMRVAMALSGSTRVTDISRDKVETGL